MSRPITFAEYMQNALYGPTGYYSSGQAQSGRAGDYFTAPDVGPIFGRLLAEQFKFWQQALGGQPFHLVEAGAGEGALAQAVGQSLGTAPTARERFLYTAVDESAARRVSLESLRTTLPIDFDVRASLAPFQSHPIHGCIFANELIDALPVHRVRQHHGVLQEAYVDDSRGWRWREPSTPRLQGYFDRLGITLAEGVETEVNLAMHEWIQQAAGALGSGLILLIDYGRPAHDYYAPERDRGTLRGFQNHQVRGDVLSSEGMMDLTADVDFTSLALDAREAGLEPAAFFDLAAFLMPSAERLLATEKSGNVGLRYLLHPEGLGGAFHVLVLKKNLPDGAVSFEHNRLSRLALDRRGK